MAKPCGKATGELHHQLIVIFGALNDGFSTGRELQNSVTNHVIISVLY